MTLIPCSAARFSAGATALASLPAIAMTSTFWATRLLMNSICASAVAADGACWIDLATDLALRLLGAGLGDLEIGIGVELRKQADGDRSGRAFSGESGGGDRSKRERRGARASVFGYSLGFLPGLNFFTTHSNRQSIAS